MDMDLDELNALMDRVWRAMHSNGQNFERLGRISGVRSETIRAWYTGKSKPSLFYLIPVVRALGLKIKIEEATP